MRKPMIPTYVKNANKRGQMSLVDKAVSSFEKGICFDADNWKFSVWY